MVASDCLLRRPLFRCSFSSSASSFLARTSYSHGPTRRQARFVLRILLLRAPLLRVPRRHQGSTALLGKRSGLVCSFKGLMLLTGSTYRSQRTTLTSSQLVQT